MMLINHYACESCMNTNTDKLPESELVAKDKCPDYVIIKSRNIDGTLVKFSHKQTVKRAYKAMIKGEYPYISVIKRINGKTTLHWIWNPTHDSHRETYESLKRQYEHRLTFTQIVDMYLVMTRARPGCLITTNDIVDDWPKPLKAYYTDKQPCICAKAKHFYYLSLHESENSIPGENLPAANADIFGENEHIARGEFLGYPYPMDISKINARTVTVNIQCNKYVFSCYLPDHLEFSHVKYMFRDIIAGLSHILVDQPRLIISDLSSRIPTHETVDGKDVEEFLASINNLPMK